MFKKKCQRCYKKVERSFDFCPYCGNPLKKPNYGLLGEDDFLPSINPGALNVQNKGDAGIFGKLSVPLIEKFLTGTLKMLEKEMQRGQYQKPRTNVELFINGERVPVKGFQEKVPQSESQKERKQKSTINIPPEEIIRRSSKLPREEAKTKVIRFKDKLIYEVKTPGLEDIKNVLINKLENSIEVRAYTPKVVYFRTIPIKLALMKVYLEKENLFLEFKL